jgi:hypothetical protein
MRECQAFIVTTTVRKAINLFKMYLLKKDFRNRFPTLHVDVRALADNNGSRFCIYIKPVPVRQALNSEAENESAAAQSKSPNR